MIGKNRASHFYLKLLNLKNPELKIHLYIFGSQLLERITFFIFYIIIARKIAIEEYGLIVTVFAFLNIINGILDLGLPFYLQREFASTKVNTDKFIHALLIRSVTLIGYLILPVIYFQSYQADFSIIILIISINFIYGFGNLFQGVLNGIEAYRENFNAFCISRLILFMSFIALFFLDTNTRFYLLLINIIILLQLILQWKSLNINFNSFSFKNIKISAIKLTLRSSLPIGVGLIFVTIYDRIDILLIEKFIDLKSVAIYSVAYAIYRNASLFSGMILTKSYTDFSRFFILDKVISYTSLKNTFYKLLFLSSIIILLFFLFPEIIIQILFGDGFTDSYDVLRYLSIGILFIFLNNFTGVILNSIRKEKITMYSVAIATFLNIGLNIILIPSLGIIGAVIASISTELFTFFMQLISIIIINKKYIVIKT